MTARRSRTRSIFGAILRVGRRQTLTYSITIDDPVIFTQPFTLDRFREAAPGVEIEPFDCVLQWQDSGG